MKQTENHLLDLPLDILLIILPYLDPRSFLSLCGTCKAFQHPDISCNVAYWKAATRSTFRVPNQPLLQADGQRWRRMYKRLLTQSRVFTWGNNERGCLGPRIASNPPDAPYDTIGGGGTAWPNEVSEARNIGIIADMQCG